MKSKQIFKCALKWVKCLTLTEIFKPKGIVQGKSKRKSGICWQWTTKGSHTFREGFPSYFYFCREPRSSWTKSFKFRWSFQRTLLTLKAPCCPHWTAASIHSVSAWDLWGALLIFMLQVATLQANVCWAIEQHVERERENLVHRRGILFQNLFTGHFPHVFVDSQEGTKHTA